MQVTNKKGKVYVYNISKKCDVCLLPYSARTIRQKKCDSCVALTGCLNVLKSQEKLKTYEKTN